METGNGNYNASITIAIITSTTTITITTITITITIQHYSMQGLVFQAVRDGCGWLQKDCSSFLRLNPVFSHLTTSPTLRAAHAQDAGIACFWASPFESRAEYAETH